MPGQARRAALLFASLLLTLACLAAVAQAGGSARAHRAAAVPLGGINLSGLEYGSVPSDADREIAQAVALHATAVRAELPWSVLQPTGAGPLDAQALAYTDRLLSDATAHHIAVIALIDGTPCWASSAPAQLASACVPGRDSGANDWPPARPEDFGALASALAQRYGNQLTALEVWNEPDQANEDYFAGPNKPQRYAAILKAGYVAVKQADPQIKVLAGSLVGSSGTFLRLLYANGIKGYYDGLAVHFYTLTLAALRAFRAVQVANGDTTPLWLDEFGWTTCYPRKKIEDEQGCVTRAIQAQNITNIFRALSSTSYVAAETLFTLRDSDHNEFGVLDVHGARKPSYSALSRVLSSPFGKLSPITLHLRKAGRQVVASGSGPVGDFMQLEAFQGRLLRFKAEFSLDRFNRFSIALPKVLGTHLRVRVFQEWTGPSAGTQKSL